MSRPARPHALLVTASLCVGCGGAAPAFPIAPPRDPSPAVASPADPRAPAPGVRSAIVAAEGTGRIEGGTYVGYDGQRTYYAIGLPGVSADGRVVAIVSSYGDGADDATTLVWVSVDGRSPHRVDPLSESRAADQETPAEVERQRAAGEQILHAARLVEQGGLRALVRLADAQEPETARAGASILEWNDDGWVVIRDPGPGRVRFREQLVVPAPGPPDDLDDEALEEWEIEHECDVPGLDAAAAWLVDAEHVLLELTVNPTPDACASSDEHRIVTLSP